MGMQVEYSLWLGAAIALGLASVLWLGKQRRMDGGMLREALLTVLGGALVGSRLVGMAGALLGTFPVDGGASHLFSLLLLGGNSLQGALFGGALVLAFWARWGRYPGWALADLMAVALCFGGVLAWVASLRYGLAYGVPRLQGPILHALPDAHGLMVLRWPVQEVAAIAFLLLGLLLVILHLRLRWPSGVLALLALWAIHLILFVLGFFRDDPTILVGTFRLGQVSALFWLGGAALLLPSRWQKKEAAR